MGFGIGLIVWGVIVLSLVSSYQISVLMILDGIVLSVLFAYDGYKTAEEVNQDKKK